MNTNASLLQRVLRIAALACLTLVLFAQVPPGTNRADTTVPPGAYSVIAEVRAAAGKTDELRAATEPLIALVRGDPKNLVYFFQEDRESPGRFLFYEVWANKADFEAHNNMPYVRAWFERLPALADGGVKVTRMHVF